MNNPAPKISRSIVDAVGREFLNIDRLSAAALTHETDKTGRAYLLALQAVTEIAQRLFVNMRHDNEALMRIVLDATTANLPLSQSESLQPPELTLHLRTLEHHRRQVIESLSLGDSTRIDANLSAALQNAAYSLIAMLLEHRVRGEQMESLARKHSSAIRSHVEIMRQSLDIARLKSSTPHVAIEHAFRNALSLKLAAHGRIPKLILVHDLDNNLLPNESYNRSFPNWCLFRKAREVHDTYFIAPWQVRFPVLSIFGAAHEASRASNAALLHVQAEQAYQFMFSDARKLFDTLAGAAPHETSIQSVISTAGNRLVATALAQKLAISSAMVHGVDERSCAGFDKPWTVLNCASSSPENIVICSDDSDSSLVQNLSAPSVIEGSEIAAPLANLCFFAARTPGAGEADTFALHKALRSAKIPFLENTSTKAELGRLHGYQGVRQYVAWYREWVAQHNSMQHSVKPHLSTPTFTI